MKEAIRQISTAKDILLWLVISIFLTSVFAAALYVAFCCTLVLFVSGVLGNLGIFLSTILVWVPVSECQEKFSTGTAGEVRAIVMAVSMVVGLACSIISLCVGHDEDDDDGYDIYPDRDKQGDL